MQTFDVLLGSYRQSLGKQLQSSFRKQQERLRKRPSENLEEEKPSQAKLIFTSFRIAGASPLYSGYQRSSNQSLERNTRVAPQTHRSPDTIFFKGSAIGRLPEHLSVSHRNLQKQIQSISRPMEAPTNTFGADLKQSIYFEDGSNKSPKALISLPLRKQPLLSRVRKLERNDQYFMSKLQENRHSLAVERHEKSISDLQCNKQLEANRRNLQEMIQQIGLKEQVDVSQPHIITSRCSIVDILRESQMHWRNKAFDIFVSFLEKSNEDMVRVRLKQLRSFSRKLQTAIRIQNSQVALVRLAFEAIQQSHKHPKGSAQDALEVPASPSVKLKGLKRVLSRTHKLELLRCFYRFRLAVLANC